MKYRLLQLMGDIERPTLAVIRSASSFQRLWAAAHAKQFDMRFPGQPRVPPVPPIDWATEIVIVAALGQRATLSYDVQLSLSEEPTGLQVLVHERQPRSDEAQLEAISYPTVLAIVRTDAIDVAFHLLPPVEGYEPTLEQETMRREAYERWLSEHPEARQS
jgi:hypothetical protein